MAFLRLIVVVAALAAVLSAGAYVFTRDRKYLVWSYRVLKITAALAFVFFAVLFVEEFWFRPAG